MALGASVGEMFMAMTGVKMQHVPTAGRHLRSPTCWAPVQVIFDNILDHRAYPCRLVARLGCHDAERSPQLADVQAIAETVSG